MNKKRTVLLFISMREGGDASTNKQYLYCRINELEEVRLFIIPSIITTLTELISM